MGQVRQDNVQIKLEIDGSQSKTELDNLTRKAQLLQTGLKEMKRGTDEYIAANKELREVNTRMTELRNDIGITGLSLNQLGKLSKQLSRELQDLTPGTEAFIAKTKEFQEVDGRLTGLRREIRGVQDDLDNAGGGVGDFIKKAIGFAGIQLGVEAVVSGLKELGTESIAEFEQAQNAAAQLEATLNSTGNAAGLTKDKLLDLSTALEGKTIFDGDAITQAQSVLLTFTKIKKGVYEEAVPAITDMATKL
jgi:chromosome segregation ATPase